MLVLSRQRDQSIIIGDKIVVTIVDVRGDKVRLGIEAPQEVPVHRREVYDAIQQEKREKEHPQDVRMPDMNVADPSQTFMPLAAHKPNA